MTNSNLFDCWTERSAGLALLRMLPVAGEPVLNDELTEALWLDRPPVTGLKARTGFWKSSRMQWRSWL
jgi:hypothetical protein